MVNNFLVLHRFEFRIWTLILRGSFHCVYTNPCLNVYSNSLFYLLVKDICFLNGISITKMNFFFLFKKLSFSFPFKTISFNPCITLFNWSFWKLCILYVDESHKFFWNKLKKQWKGLMRNTSSSMLAPTRCTECFVFLQVN